MMMMERTLTMRMMMVRRRTTRTYIGSDHMSHAVSYLEKYKIILSDVVLYFFNTKANNIFHCHLFSYSFGLYITFCI
jgi:hypothetical protein